MLTIAAAGGGLTVLLSLLPVEPVQDDPGRCTVSNSQGLCLVEAADPARPGGPQDRRGRRDARDPGQAGATRSSGEPSEPGGNAAAAGTGGVAAPEAGLSVPRLETEFTGAAAPVAPGAPVSPAVLARRAIELLALDAPALRISAQDRAYVGAPVWLWIEGGRDATGPVSATATAGASEVTATARLVAVEWAMGPPGAAVRCQGTGTPWTGQAGPSPDCGFVYEKRSLPERTGGLGRWPITATAIWDITWTGTSAGAPVTGTQELALTTESSLAVGEVQVLVSEGGTR